MKQDLRNKSGSVDYKHTQVGTLILFISFILALYFGFIISQTGLTSEILIIMIIVLAILLSFHSLTVTIDKEHLRIKFGYGIYSKRFNIKEIVSVTTVKNHWYYGWGIRYTYWPRMRIFNVSGFDAVEIVLKDKKIYCIGTDQPNNLGQAIQQAIKK